MTASRQPTARVGPVRPPARHAQPPLRAGCAPPGPMRQDWVAAHLVETCRERLDAVRVAVQPDVARTEDGEQGVVETRAPHPPGSGSPSAR